jgi:adenine-specific DNA-methyltransferase
MNKIEVNDPAAQSADIVADNLLQLQSLFPEAFAEGKVQFDTLRQLLGGTVDEADEKYGLNWHGKRRARQIALTPSTGTLRPCPDESVDWATTQNLMIEGDNLEVLKLLQKSYAGKVKLIYIDPPYNTGKDFVYPDNFRDSIGNYLELTGQVEGGARMSANTDASGRFHTDWLNMIYPRLRLARGLLNNDGVLMVSVDDTEVGHMRSLLAELYGDENFLSILIWNKQHSQQQGVFKKYHEYIFVVTRNASLISNIEGGDGEIDAGALKKISAANPASNFAFPAGVRFEATDGFELSGTFGESEQVTVVSGRFVCKDGKTEFPVTLSAGWTQKNQMTSWFSGQETYDTKEQKVVEFYFTSTGKLKCRKERSKITPPSLLPEYGMVSEQTAYLEQLMGATVFQNPKPVQMIADFVTWFVKPGEIVMDFFAGSGTTGESTLKVNATKGDGRRFILVQLPEPLDESNKEQIDAVKYCRKHEKPLNISELTKERLRRAGKKLKGESPMFSGDVGFRVFKLDKSNIREWNPDQENLAQTLLDHHEHILDGRTEDDIVYELLLKLGLDLCVTLESRTVAGKTVGAVGGGVLMLCLAEKISAMEVETVAAGIVSWHKELAPAGDSTVVFRDSAFADDVAKTNMAAILAQNGLENVRSL